MFRRAAGLSSCALLCACTAGSAEPPEPANSHVSAVGSCAGAPATTWYVRAFPASNNPQGTKSKPFTTLAQAEAASAVCDTIMILQSAPALNGGIHLKDGQKLIGKGTGWTFPRITNSSNASNDGHGVILANDNEVTNLHIDGTYGSGIVAANVTGASVHGMLITGTNSSNTLDEDISSPLFGHPAHAGIVVVGEPGANIAASIEDTAVVGATTFGVLVMSHLGSSVEATFDGLVILGTKPGALCELCGPDPVGVSFTTEATVESSADVAISKAFVQGADNYQTEDNIWAVSNVSSNIDLSIDKSIVRRANNNNVLQEVSAGLGGNINTTLTNSLFEDGQENVEQFSHDIIGAGLPFDSISTEIDNCHLRAARRRGVEIFPENMATFSLSMSDSTVDDSAETGIFVGLETPSNYTVDLGGGALGSSGGNSIVDNAVQVHIQGGANIVAQGNWWGSPAGLDPASVVLLPDAIGNVGSIDASNPLQSDPND